MSRPTARALAEGVGVALFAVCGLLVGMGCGCPEYAQSAIVANTNHADLAGAHVYVYGDRVELTYARWNDTGWRAVFSVARDPAVPLVDTADTAR